MSQEFLNQVLADLDAALADWGEAVTVGGAAKTAIFDNDYTTISLAMGDLASADAMLQGKTSDLSSAAKGTTVVARSVNYTVSHPPKPDGQGWTVLILKKA